MIENETYEGDPKSLDSYMDIRESFNMSKERISVITNQFENQVNISRQSILATSFNDGILSNRPHIDKV